MGRSKNLVVRESIMGVIQALIPRIRRTLAIFEPNTFQIAISVFQEILASIETINSGILVPTATIVRPIMAWDIQNFFAIDTEPSTRTFPQKVRRMSQKITAIHDNKISIVLYKKILFSFFYLCLNEIKHFLTYIVFEISIFIYLLICRKIAIKHRNEFFRKNFIEFHTDGIFT